MKFKIIATRTVTTVSTCEKVIDLPTDSADAAKAYVSVALGFGDFSDKSPLRYASWTHGEPVETRACDVVIVEESDIVEAMSAETVEGAER